MIYIDAKGDKLPVNLDVSMYRSAADAGQSLPQFLATEYPTNAEKHGSVFNQMMEQAGIFVRPNAEIGLRASTMDEILSPKGAAAVTKDGIPASRILFPAAILSVIENKLLPDLESDPAAFDAMVAVDDSIAGDRFERPVLDFSAPTGARSGPVSQLALPPTMLTITASDISKRVPTWGIGMEISEQALRSTTLDLVGLAMSRQASVERNERTNGYLLAMLNGDVDTGDVALSSITGKVVTATSLDATVTGAGNLSHKAWIFWLSRNANKRKITHVVTDLAGAWSIENRTGRPTYSDNLTGVTRINTPFTVVNPKWPSEVQVFITTNPAWPANTIVGMDNRYSFHRVKSLSAEYSAIEQFVLRRSTSMRVDSGELVYRLFDEAFEVLSLT